MTWLIKNIGLTILGLCICLSAAGISDSMDKTDARLKVIESRLEQSQILAGKLNQLALAIPASQLRPVK